MLNFCGQISHMEAAGRSRCIQGEWSHEQHFLLNVTSLCPAAATTAAAPGIDEGPNVLNNKQRVVCRRPQQYGCDCPYVGPHLTSLDATLSADRTSRTTGESRSKLDPSTMKDKIDNLIADQVSAGTLTDDQASELMNLFASGGQSTSASSGPTGAGGPPPGPPLDDAKSDTSLNNSASSSSNTASLSELLSSFITQLQSLQASNSSYGASGMSMNSYSSSALVLDTTA